MARLHIKTRGGRIVTEVSYMDPKDLKPDPNQPRQNVSDEDIEAMAQTFLSQGIINPLEIDKNNVIVTGEIRWRAALKAGIDKVPCLLWQGKKTERLERQVIENLHRRNLNSIDRENAIWKLWESGKYGSQAELSRKLGIHESSVDRLIGAKTFRSENINTLAARKVSTAAISETAGLNEGQRLKILEAHADDKVSMRNIRDYKKAGQVSDKLLDAMIDGTVSEERATLAVKTIEEIEEKRELDDEWKNRFIDRVIKDEKVLDEYKEDIHDRVYESMTAKKGELPTSLPVGRTSPVDKMVATSQEMEGWTNLIRLMDLKEKRHAKRVLLQIREKIDKFLSYMPEDQA